MIYPKKASYQGNPNADNYVCGSCKRTQDPREGERCIKCGKPTVTWLKSQGESWEEALKKWRKWYS
ncbi:MAG: hypothetical protein WBV73_12715 [Phormidium sp.]